MTDSPYVTVSDLTAEHFNERVTVDGCGSGWLYGIHDDFNDGYPSRTLIVVTNQDGDVDEWEFTDSNPMGYPKTMRVSVTIGDERG